MRHTCNSNFMNMFIDVTQDCMYLNHTFISRGSSDCFIIYQVLKTQFFISKKVMSKFYLQIPNSICFYDLLRWKTFFGTASQIPTLDFPWPSQLKIWQNNTKSVRKTVTSMLFKHNKDGRLVSLKELMP